MTTPAGWYPDPHTGQQRYYDGTQWGPYAPTGPPVKEARFTVNYGFVLLALLSLLMTLFPAIAWITGDKPNDPDDDFLVTMGVLWLFWGGFWTLVWAAFGFQHTLRSKMRR